ncbi:MAG: two-component regulator propeller domain-containing protein [Dehalogenimonas sp.]
MRPRIIISAIVVTISLFIYTPSLVTSQSNFNFEHITSKDGLPSDSMYCTHQDNLGFLWFGTFSGLCLYDGIKIQVFDHSPSNQGSLSSNWVSCISSDTNGDVWVGTENDGLNVLKRNTGIFRHYKFDSGDPNSISNNNIRVIFLDSNNHIWIGTDKGLNIYSSDGDCFINANNNLAFKGLSNAIIRSIIQIDDETLIIGTSFGLFSCNLTSHEITSLINFNNQISNPISVWCLLHVSNILWVGTSNGLFKYDLITSKLLSFKNDQNDNKSLSNNQVFSITDDTYGRLWVGTQFGLNLLDADQNNFQRLFYEPGNDLSLSNNIIRDLMTDQSGIVWVITNGGGINKYDSRKSAFKYYDYSSGKNTSLSNKDIYSILTDNQGSLWVGTANGLNRISIQGTFDQFFNDPTNSGSLSYNIIRALCSAKDGSIWVGTLLGLNKYDMQTGVFSRYISTITDSNTLSSNSILSVAEDADGRIWVGTYVAGLNCIDLQQKTISRYVADSTKSGSIVDNTVNCLLNDSKGNLWIGTMRGLNLYDPRSDSFSLINKDDSNLSNIMVIDLIESKNGILWLATNGNGVIKYDPKSDLNTLITTKDGLSSNTIVSIEEDNKGNIWLGTNKGLNRLDPATMKIQVFSIADGLPSDTFSSRAGCNVNGTLYFGTNNGLVFFDPADLQISKFTPPLFITDVTINAKRIQATDSKLNYSKTVLPFGKYIIEFNFASLDYSSPNANLYAYRLTPYQRDWTYVSAGESAIFQNLPSGNYTFEVKGSNSSGVWNTPLQQVYIKIVPPIWMSWWFISLVSLFAVGIVFAGFRLRVRALRIQNIHLENIVNQRTIELNQMYVNERELHHKLEKQVMEQTEYTRVLVHELKTPITSLQAASELLEEEVKSEPMLSLASSIKRAIYNLDNRIDELLDLARGEVGLLKINPSILDPRNVLLGIFNDFTPVATLKQKTLKIDIPDYLPQVIADRERFVEIMQNLLSNSIKYTSRNGVITLSAHAIDGAVQISVTDNGCGINKQDLESIFIAYHKRHYKDEIPKPGGLGIGLSLSKMLIDLHGGRIWAESDKGKGCKISFTLPTDKRNNKNASDL